MIGTTKNVLAWSDWYYKECVLAWSDCISLSGSSGVGAEISVVLLVLFTFETILEFETEVSHVHGSKFFKIESRAWP